MIKKIITVAIFYIFCSCSFTSLIIKGRGDVKLKQVDFADLSGWTIDSQNKAVISLVNSCNKFAKMPNNKKIGAQIGDITVADFRDVCDIAETIKGMSAAQARNFFENWFIPFEVSDSSNNNKGLFTGYYVPELKGSKTKSEIYQYPVYSRPQNFNSVANLTRSEIENGALAKQGLEIVYVSDKIDLFFMQVQGSGRVILDDGSIMRLGFGGKTNQPYSSIGKYIIENKLITDGDVSYFSIKNWLKNNPEKANDVLNINKSFIFFKISNSDEVIGSQGSPLMAERSLAIDSDIIPLGFPVWLNINNKNKQYQRLLITQDTGSAIKGAVRGDIFFGRGKNAEGVAATMNHKGKYFILLPTAAVDRVIGR